MDSSTEATTATTSFGKVAGYRTKGVFVYKGIPYAKAERFSPAEDPDPWTEVRSCRAYGPVCPQAPRTGWADDKQAFAFNWNDGIQGEDCLRLNIWTPSVSDGGKRPVMVWLHGGGFHSGSGQEHASYDGTALASGHDVVVVTLNHRLNVLGFLDLSGFGEKYAQSGNLGMTDIVKALQWVKNNISNFGGDPSNVTIFGQSGGGGKVSTLMAMPSAKGLFHKAVVQSGSISRVMDKKYSRRIGTYTVQELGLSPSDADKIRAVPYKDLYDACQRAIGKVRDEMKGDGALSENILEAILTGTEPTVDGATLPHHPGDPESIALSKDIPLIIGTTHDEFTPGKEDAIFKPLAVKQASDRAAARQSVYLYQFDWTSPVLDGSLGSMHCMEIPFVFDNVALMNNMTGGKAEDVALGHKVSTLWTSFAKTGVPGAEGMPSWEKYSPSGGKVLHIDRDSQCK